MPGAPEATKSQTSSHSPTLPEDSVSVGTSVMGLGFRVEGVLEASQGLGFRVNQMLDLSVCVSTPNSMIAHDLKRRAGMTEASGRVCVCFFE